MQTPAFQKTIFTKAKQHLIIFLWLTALYSLTACSSSGSDNSKGQQAETAVTTEKDLSNIKVGYCTPSLNAPFYVALSKAIQENAEKYGMKFVSVDGQGDISKQITAVEDLTAKGIDVLILNPLDPKALIPTVNAASKSGLPVFIVDSYIEPEARYITSVIADNQSNGELIGEWAAGKLGKTSIKAAIISGAQGNPVGKEKRLGFVRGLTEAQLRSLGYSDFKIVSQGWGGWSNNGGLKAMEDILSAHPDINLLVAENDAMAMGALKAINEAGKGAQIQVAAFDGQKEALELIKQDKYGATALNSPVQLGKLVVESVVKHLNGDKYLDKVIYTPSVLITKTEVGKFYDPKAIF